MKGTKEPIKQSAGKDLSKPIHSVPQSAWAQHLEELKRFRKEHGHCNVPSGYPQNTALGHWVTNLRQRKKRGTLTEDKIRILDALGFCWERKLAIATAMSPVWKQRFNELNSFKKEHGHCNVPSQYPPNQPLASWVAFTRSQKKAGKLAEERIRCLEELGFCWSLRVRSVRRLDWDVMLAALAAFAERYRHCNVPYMWPENPRLSWYVKSLRGRKRKGKLDRRQIAQLNKLGIVWELRPKPTWSEMYAALAEYKKVHGDCNVPRDWPRNPFLGAWIPRQREARKTNLLEQGHIEQLDKLGFAWDYLEYQWETQYSALVEFREEYGHCRVSTLWKTHAALANWVRTQRKNKKQGKLSAERIRRLDMLGFIWDVSMGRSRPIENAPKTGVPRKPKRSWSG
jgi:hypothetical protein